MIVGSAEDALCAMMLNPDIAAVVIHEGFGSAPGTTRRLPHLIGPSRSSRRRLGTAARPVRSSGSARSSTSTLSAASVEEIAGDPAPTSSAASSTPSRSCSSCISAILEGVQARYETPFFDNLKKYAQRPIGTFHALPIARGKSIFKSDWIRDMGEFYGMNLFLAESSATTGGLDSLLEPTGNIKVAQEKAARAFGARPCVLRHQRHVDLQQDGGAGDAAPGDIVLVDRNCHKSHHYGMVLSRRAAAVCRGVSADAVLDVWRGAAAHDQAGPARPQGARASWTACGCCC